MSLWLPRMRGPRFYFFEFRSGLPCLIREKGAEDARASMLKFCPPPVCKVIPMRHEDGPLWLSTCVNLGCLEAPPLESLFTSCFGLVLDAYCFYPRRIPPRKGLIAPLQFCVFFGVSLQVGGGGYFLFELRGVRWGFR